jgi:hypothetical protein
MSEPRQSAELVSVDESIDAIAREALEEARRKEEAERYLKNPGAVVPPPMQPDVMPSPGTPAP